MEKVIDVEKLSFGYSYEPIFEDVSFSVGQGDFLAVIGSNGAGKSTLLKLLLGELAPLRGSIKLLGQNISNFKNWSKIGYVSQDVVARSANFPATAEEIVQLNLCHKFCVFPKKEDKEKTKQALALVGMEAYAKKMISDLSGGQQQRVMLAQVLVDNPELMLLDEPTSGLDAQTTQALYELLLKLNQKTGLTIVMVTHDIGKAVNYVSRTLCLDEGSMVELDKRQIEEEISHKHKHPLRKQ